jgi:hypothetical protein
MNKRYATPAKRQDVRYLIKTLLCELANSPHLSVRLEHIPGQAYTRSKRRRHSWAAADRRCSFSPSCPAAV